MKNDKSIQEERELKDQSNQYDDVEVVNKSLQNSMVGSDKEVQIEAEHRDKSVQPSLNGNNEASVQEAPSQRQQSVQRTEPNNINYKAIERSINPNDSQTIQSKEHS